MTAQEIRRLFETKFDAVGVIRSSTYLNEARRLEKQIPDPVYPTLVVLGLSYERRLIKETKTHLVPSFYTFGRDYHGVLKARIDAVMADIRVPYEALVDNHPHDERLAAVLSGIGTMGKNQLIIHDRYGSYIFLALVWMDVILDQESILDVVGDCGTCRRCIDACPSDALFEGGYDINRCVSQYNQSKRALTSGEMDAHTVLFGCDICQIVCPRNIGVESLKHPEFALSGKEQIAIHDLFTLSNKAFAVRYEGMAYLWKGKTVLMRNALLTIRKKHLIEYRDQIRASMKETMPDWYLKTAKRVLHDLKLDGE
ncbi:MAG: DUF1730 domain-containing protein [Acholeplasmataceae bacterium]|nr:DUF1730 domain-containing protein [Acholeplasmataceae bacterium]